MPKNRIAVYLTGVILGCTGCVKNLAKPDALASSYDEIHTFTVPLSFESVYAAIDQGAKTCWASVSGGQMMPFGSGYIVAGNGIKREVEESIIQPGKSASISIVIHAAWPFPPAAYILRADIRQEDVSETKVTTYNADANHGQRSFHHQVQRWVNGNTSDCNGMGIFDGAKDAAK